jgi:hypothetical protein
MKRARTPLSNKRKEVGSVKAKLVDPSLAATRFPISSRRAPTILSCCTAQLNNAEYKRFPFLRDNKSGSISAESFQVTKTGGKIQGFGAVGEPSGNTPSDDPRVIMMSLQLKF